MPVQQPVRLLCIIYNLIIKVHMSFQRLGIEFCQKMLQERSVVYRIWFPDEMGSHLKKAVRQSRRKKFFPTLIHWPSNSLS